VRERRAHGAPAPLLRRARDKRGITVPLQAGPAALRGIRRIEAVELADRRTLEADLVVVAIGIRPNVELARTAGLDIGRGVIVDDGLRTSNADIFAIGECAEHRGTCYGLVEPAYEQARVLARRLAGAAPATYARSGPATRL